MSELATDDPIAVEAIDASPRPARIASLDVLRGVGVLGMLAVHIQLFAFPSLARWNPTAYGDFHGANWWVWLVTALCADGKFISIFAILLGAGMVMQAGHRARTARATHMRRMGALFVLGSAHAYALWYGDMLVPLAVCGAAVFWARSLSARRLLVLGCAAFAAASVMSFALTWSAVHSHPDTVAAWRREWTPRPSLVGLEVLRYRGGWTEQMAHRVPAAWEIQTWYLATRLFWQMAGLMLMGMAFFKLGLLSGLRSRAYYGALACVGFGAGILLNGLGLWRSAATQWDLLDFVLISQQLHYWGNLLAALGWMAAVILLCRRPRRPLRWIAAVGRVALSNYLLQTVICTTIFYGHGLGQFGRIDRTGQLGIVLAVWTFEVFASSVWLRYFAVGPIEWLVRWVAYGQRPSLVHAPPIPARI